MVFLQLIRLPNVFTVVADILMGFLFVHPNLQPVGKFALTLVSAIFLYWAGMVLNDVFDVEQDRKERPERPIPSGKISLPAARALGFGLLLTGVVAGWAVGWVQGPSDLPWRSGVVATAIAVFVLGYDWALKKTVFGPLLMGLCRFGNVLLGMSAGAVIDDYATPVLGFDAAQLAVAGGLGVYIMGVTWFGRNEAAEEIPKSGLVAGVVLMTLGMFWLASFTLVSVSQAGRYDITMPHQAWPLVVAVLAFSVIRRAIVVLLHPTGQGVQLVIKQCILSLIVFDAAVCLASRPPWQWSVLIVSLMIPTIFLGRWFYST